MRTNLSIWIGGTKLSTLSYSFPNPLAGAIMIVSHKAETAVYWLS